MRKLCLVICLLVLIAICGAWVLSYAAVPHLINYQGRLTDTSGVPLNGSYSITFRIYDAETAGNLLWEEAQSGVVIQKGIFNVLLGSVINLSLAFDKPYFLEIKVGSEVMSPRQRIASAGYAIMAGMAEDVISIPRGVIAMWYGSISNIPQGWALCDGTNGTPDLRDKFIVGAKQDEDGVAKTNITGSLSQSGGSTSITVSNLPAHHHYAPAHFHTLPGNGGSPGGFLPNNWSAGGEINTSSSGAGNTNDTGSGAPYTQPYYTLTFIMKL